MRDLGCPYCGADNEVCHDDGAGYEDDRRHEMACRECDKSFVFTTFISFSYESHSAECLNTGKHRLKETMTYPKRYAKMACQDCDYEESLPVWHPYLQERDE